MNANANDIRLFNKLKKYCVSLKLEIELVGSEFSLTQKSGMCLGRFIDVHSLSQYIFGYEAGYSKGKNTGYETNNHICKSN